MPSTLTLILLPKIFVGATKSSRSPSYTVVSVLEFGLVYDLCCLTHLLSIVLLAATKIVALSLFSNSGNNLELLIIETKITWLCYRWPSMDVESIPNKLASLHWFWLYNQQQMKLWDSWPQPLIAQFKSMQHQLIIPNLITHYL